MNATPRRQIFRPPLRPSSPSRRKIPTTKLLLTTLAMTGIQTCYSAQFNLVTSHFLHLHIPVHLVSLAWLAGPLSGLIVQPIVGLLSDRCTHPLGRRRPFLIIGSMLTAISMLLFANAENLASLIVRLVPAAPTQNTLALAVAVMSFFMLDFSVQAVQAPLRALLTDVLPPSQLASGNSCIALFVGLGNLIGSLLAAIHLTPFLKNYGIDMTHIHVVFFLCSLILLGTVAATVLSTKEKPLRRAQRTTAVSELVRDERRWQVRVKMLIKVLRNIPRPFWQVFCVQLCTWCGFFTLFVYLNAWVGKNVYHGLASAPPGTDARNIFEQGVRLGAMGNALMAVITMAYSAVLPHLLEFRTAAIIRICSSLEILLEVWTTCIGRFRIENMFKALRNMYSTAGSVAGVKAYWLGFTPKMLEPATNFVQGVVLMVRSAAGMSLFATAVITGAGGGVCQVNVMSHDRGIKDLPCDCRSNRKAVDTGD